jgi:chromosome segregation protein
VVASQQSQTEQELAGIDDELSRRRAVLQPLREAVNTLSRSEREMYELFAAKRTELLALERASMEAESAVNRRGQAIDRLRDEMEADGVDLVAPPVDQLFDEAGSSPRPVVAAAGEAVPAEGVATTAGRPAVLVGDLQAKTRSLRARIRNFGPINARAGVDYRESLERHEFLTSQVSDLQQAEASLQEALEELRRVVRERFRETFHAVNGDFARYFKTFFGGGTARLALTEPEDYGESGVDIVAQPPGKRQQHLQLLSGGERSMTAVALLFALLETNPAPFCVLDEVDAALDEANIGRFGEALGDLATRTQFIIITHNQHTLQSASTIYGISMGGDGVSSVLSLRLEEVPVGA